MLGQTPPDSSQPLANAATADDKPSQTAPRRPIEALRFDNTYARLPPSFHS